MKVRLKQIRLSRGLSQNKLAQLVDMTLQNVQKIEYGKTKGLQYDALNKLCKVLDCQPGDLLVYEPDDESPEQITNRETLEKVEQVMKSDNGSPAIAPHRPHSLIPVVLELLESA